MYAGNLPIVPDDRDGIPACFADNSAIGGIASPINPGTLLEVLRFGDCHSYPSVVCGRAQYRKKVAAVLAYGRRIAGAQGLSCAGCQVGALSQTVAAISHTSPSQRQSRRISPLRPQTISSIVRV